MKNKSVLVLAILLSFFVCQKYISASEENGAILINEIAWMGTLTSSADEWIELKNNGAVDIDLKNWQLVSTQSTFKISLSGIIKAGDYYLLERTDDNSVPEIKADQIYSGALSNTGENLELKNSNGIIIDSVNAQSSWTAGDNTSKQTMERAGNLSWQNSALPHGTPQKKNSGEASVQSPSENITAITNNRLTFSNDILISEFVADPDEDNTEWIELYNTTPREINLTDWTITDGAGSASTLSGSILANDFLVIESPKGKLNNAGDLISLRDENNVVINEIAYGNFDDGDTSDNAPTANNPASVARQKENYNTGNNSADFKITDSPSKGFANTINAPLASIEETKNTPSSSHIIITEIFPDPYGTDYENEFIEIYNSSDKALDLNNYRLENKLGKVFTFSKIELKPYEHYAVMRKNSQISLNNLADTVKLFSGQSDKAIQTITYKNSQTGWSYNFNLATSTRIANKWTWENSPTPNKNNQIRNINQAPIVEFYCSEKARPGEAIFFDSSDTFDYDSSVLKFSWDFGDGTTNSLTDPEHTYFKTGKYTVTLSVFDGENEIKKQKTILITDNLNIDSDETNPGSNANINSTIIINEIFPAPNSNDKNGEWIEIYNHGDVKINLRNWRILDNSKSDFLFSTDTWLGNNSYRVIKSSESKLSLNNDFDTIQLFDNANNLIDEVEYENAPHENSLSRGLNNKWLWTNSPTPEKENIISLSKTDIYGASTSFYSSPISKTLTETSSTQDFKNFQIGDTATVRGIVTALPGKLGSQFFYIASSSGIQIYSNKKDFPEIKIGDLVEANGELSQINDEWRLKTKTKDDIKIIGQGEEVSPPILACGEVNEDYLSQLIEVSGEIVSKKGTTIFLDDGTGEIALNIKTTTDINTKDLKEGEFISATGILSGSKSGPRLLPRDEGDIVVKNIPDQGKVLGASSELETWELSEKDQNIKLYSYIIISLIGIIIILSVLLIKKKT